MKTSLHRWSAHFIFVCSLLLASFSGHALDINTATEEELQTLKGIGEKRAEAIIVYRSNNGPFMSAEDLKKVPGIGSSIISANSDALEFTQQDQH
jgi:competence protein ComEA